MQDYIISGLPCLWLEEYFKMFSILFHCLQNYKNFEKDYGLQKNFHIPPTMDAKKIFTKPMLPAYIFQFLLKSKDH